MGPGIRVLKTCASLGVPGSFWGARAGSCTRGPILPVQVWGARGARASLRCQGQCGLPMPVWGARRSLRCQGQLWDARANIKSIPYQVCYQITCATRCAVQCCSKATRSALVIKSSNYFRHFFYFGRGTKPPRSPGGYPFLAGESKPP